MQFCDDCGNVLLPKKKKNVLYCKVCNKDFPVDKAKEKLEQYKKSTKRLSRKKHKKALLKTAVVIEESRKPAISPEEREAMEDLFEEYEM